MAYADLDLGTRSDSYSLNSCPVTATVSSLRVPQNCFSKLPLLAYDPDGDDVRCSFTTDAAVPSNFALDKTTCTLTSTGQVGIGVHVFEMMLGDYPTTNITLTYADGSSVYREASNMNSPPLCKVMLQFSVEILPPIPNCEAGQTLPIFFSTTPSHGDVLYATVGQKFQLHAQAQALLASIFDFQVSGPQNMTKASKDNNNGIAEVTVSWTPKQSDLYRFVPVCFTAETNESQSEMRCVAVMVTQASITQGKATVECSPNKMTVALEKASMPGIDENYLRLRDRSCSLTFNSTHILGSMSFSTCGTKIEDAGDFIVFKNEIVSYVLPNELIIRRETVKIGFSCQFPKTIHISSYYNLHNSDYIFTESSFSSFGYTFEIFHDSNFTSTVEANAYPVNVQLLDKIYMGIQAQTEIPNVQLFVESCKATPDDNPENPTYYDLIRNGCIMDETFKVHTSDQISFNFEVQVFKFTGNYDQVYFNCFVILCEPGNPFSRCSQGCLRNPSRRRRRGLSRETVGHYITQGPLRLVRQAVPILDDKNVGMNKTDTPISVSPSPVSADRHPFLQTDTKSSEGGWVIKEILNANISTVVFASAFLVTLVLLAGVVFYFTSKRRGEDRRPLIVSGWEN
ncbi:uncharacterized protein LOC119890671 isoform X1 [Micropterus salmoides]|uniref:uncharacterized protein LOC119890671 isoform X1 n=2 Tax=Micropterus salmoides TaxID=27706 RepID=UPI0018EC900E|nr:uncharacterized protein LOC119890671 isoform X1 [Micropterus salmoides]